MLENFKVFQEAKPGTPLYTKGMQIDPDGQFEHDAMNDKLPAVSWIIPTSYQSEHPDYMPADGAAFVASKIDAIAANPDVWAKTVFILNYDENDGLFDHVAPPVPPKERRMSLWKACRLAAVSAFRASSCLRGLPVAGFAVSRSITPQCCSSSRSLRVWLSRILRSGAGRLSATSAPRSG